MSNTNFLTLLLRPMFFCPPRVYPQEVYASATPNSIPTPAISLILATPSTDSSYITSIPGSKYFPSPEKLPLYWKIKIGFVTLHLMLWDVSDGE